MSKEFLKLSTFMQFAIISLSMLLWFSSCEMKTEAISPEISNVPVYPLIPAELEGKEIDTIITFHPDTYEESVRYEIQDPEKYIQVDTIITFDPETYKESMTIIKYHKDHRDTILVF